MLRFGFAANMSSDDVSLARISAVPRPSGVIQREDYPRKRKSPDCTPDCKFLCFVCRRTVHCLCLECATHRVQLYDKREQQVKLNKARSNFVSQINRVLKEQLFLEEAIHSANECIANVSINVAQTVQRIAKKEMEFNLTNSRLDRHAKNRDDLQMWCDRHDKVVSNLQRTKQQELDEKRAQLACLRRELAFQIFSQVFPMKNCEGTCCDYLYDAKGFKRDMGKSTRASKRVVRKQKRPAPSPKNSVSLKGSLAETNDAEDDSGKTSTDDDSSNKWVMLEMPEEEAQMVQTSVRYTIGGCCVNDNGSYELKDWLRTGLPQLRAHHAAFAAILNGFHLLDILTAIFDILLPFKISMQDVALCEKWTDDLFDTDIFKLNLSVFLMCINLGIQDLDLHRPFANLIRLHKALAENMIDQTQALPVFSNALVAMEEDFKKLENWVEREPPKYNDEWCIVELKELKSDMLPAFGIQGLAIGRPAPHLQQLSRSSLRKLKPSRNMERRASDVFPDSAGYV